MLGPRCVTLKWRYQSGSYPEKAKNLLLSRKERFLRGIVQAMEWQPEFLLPLPQTIADHLQAMDYYRS